MKPNFYWFTTEPYSPKEVETEKKIGNIQQDPILLNNSKVKPTRTRFNRKHA